MTEPAQTPTDQQPTQQPQPESSQQQPADKPPWGDDFDAQRAWDLVQNLRGDKDKLKTDLTQAAEDRKELERLREERMSADEKALNAAKKEAATVAAEAAKSEYLPQIQALQVKSIASQVIQGDKLNAFMAIVNPAALVGADGSVDESMVMGHLTALYGTASQSNTPGQRWQNAGQFAPPPPGAKPGSAGQAEAVKRFGTKTT